MRKLGFTAWTVLMTTVALVQSEGIFQTGLVLICLGGALMFAVCLFADRQ